MSLTMHGVIWFSLKDKGLLEPLPAVHTQSIMTIVLDLSILFHAHESRSHIWLLARATGQMAEPFWGQKSQEFRFGRTKPVANW